MEYVRENDAPTWANMLAEILEREGKVGLFAFMSRIAKRSDLSPAVYIGCVQQGNSSNYSTTVSDLMYSMSSVDKDVSTLPCDFGVYEEYRSVLPSYIVGKHYINYNTLTIFTCGRVVLAVCDMDTREIYLSDISPNIEWSDSVESVVELIARFISEVVDMMEVGYFDKLFADIKSASVANTHVKLIEVKADTNFDINGFTASCMDALKRYERTQEESYRRVFNDMKRDLQVAQGKGIADALDLMAFMKEKHFIFVDANTLKYTGGKIIANTGIYCDAVYKTKSEMWISGLRVIIGNGVIVNAKCYRAYHPNCSGRHVCIGELSGVPIKEVDKLVDALKVPNFSNGYWSGSSDYLDEKIVNLEGVTERVWSSDE